MSATANRRGRPSEPILRMFPGWSANRIAEAAGVTRRTVVRWRRGGRVWKADSVANALGRHPSEIWQGWS